MLGLRTTLLSLFLSTAGCSTASSGTEHLGASQAALEATTTQTIAWNVVGLHAGGAEHAAFGVPAVAIGPNGDVFVLDAVNERIVRATGREVLPVASEVPLDADDLGVSIDGAMVVHRAMASKVVVLDPRGAKIGEVDTQGMGEIDSVALGASRRVVVKSAFQETFQLGSPHVPQLPEAAYRTRKVGAELLPSGDGVVTIVKDGNAELHVVAQGEHAAERNVFSLGSAASAHIVGVSANVVCMRVEHLTSDRPIAVEREARCVDATDGKTVFRADLGTPGLYVPRRELTFARGRLAFAKPEKDGLVITTWAVNLEGGAK